MGQLEPVYCPRAFAGAPPLQSDRAFVTFPRRLCSGHLQSPRAKQVWSLSQLFSAIIGLPSPKSTIPLMGGYSSLHTAKCDALDAEIQEHRKKQLTQTLIMC